MQWPALRNSWDFDAMTKYSSKLLNKHEVAKETLAFDLARPDELVFAAGQYMQVFLSDDAYDSHTFSIASAPHENVVTFATRIRPGSDFKQRLLKLAIGEEITFEAAGGSVTLPKDKKQPMTFLIGGIGITLARSMLRHMTHTKDTRHLWLFFSNRRREDTPFFDEMSKLALPHFSFIPTMTGENHLWAGGRGYIDEKMIRRYVDGVSNSAFYVVGPPQFTEGMLKVLDTMSIPSRNIKSEDYGGY